ncbi:nitroreductase [Leptobacterium flavescens]|uniref:Putative NAD(P)H nitroreductase n=1 Tax=Leptobacterium flavescens TaxID=472055 RepID=A0A6P0UKA8_9FLAO|nr:nitroreductase [Leptobacterium flavescens]NER13735.1 nitroreductase [Leptobacterium flavescens]
MSIIGDVTRLIEARKAVFPALYIEKNIPTSIINKMLSNANRAPTHKLTEPWRFKVIRGDARARLGNFMSARYKKLYEGNGFSERKFNKLRENPQLADTVIAIIMQRDREERIPEWEEIAAVSMAVQNMWLTASAHGVGSYWSSPALISHLGDFFKLEEGQKCLGLFYMGYYEEEIPVSKRGPIEEKVEWLDK